MGERATSARNLGEDIQLAVLKGKAKGVTIAELLELGKHTDLGAQQQACEELVKEAASGGGKHRSKAKCRTTISLTEQAGVRVLAVAYFNPEMFVERRRGSEQRLAEIDAFVESLNVKDGGLSGQAGAIRHGISHDAIAPCMGFASSRHFRHAVTGWSFTRIASLPGPRGSYELVDEGCRTWTQQLTSDRT